MFTMYIASQMDADGSNQISRAEFKRAFRDIWSAQVHLAVEDGGTGASKAAP